MIAIHAKTGQTMFIVERLGDGSVLGALTQGGETKRYILRSAWVEQEEGPKARRARLLKVVTARRARLGESLVKAQTALADAVKLLGTTRQAHNLIQAEYDEVKNEQYQLSYGGDV